MTSSLRVGRRCRVVAVGREPFESTVDPCRERVHVLSAIEVAEALITLYRVESNVPRELAQAHRAWLCKLAVELVE